MDSSKQTTTDLTDITSQPTSDDKTALLGVYGEICKSHQAIDDFRMKLLGLLPLASLTGIFVISRSDSVFSTPNVASGTSSNHLVAFIGIFAATFTLALFMYEIRGILRCSDLIYRGSKIEKTLKVFGQFSVCRDQHESNKHLFFNAKVAACVVYSVVFAAWFFLALRQGFGLQIRYCVFTALSFGLILAVGVHWLINKRIAA